MRIFFLSLFWVGTFALQAQTLRSLFVNMPDSLSLLLTKNDKADFVDFLDSQMKARVKNKFEGVSELKVLTSDYLQLQVTSVSTLQLKLLSVNDSTQVIFAVETFRGPASDSHLSVYNSNWKPLAVADYMEALPVQTDFLLTSDTIDVEKRDAALRYADLFLMEANLDAGTAELKFTYTTPDYMDKESANELRPYLVAEPLKYVWQSGRFVRQF